jgi:hypothetical protein
MAKQVRKVARRVARLYSGAVLCPGPQDDQTPLPSLVDAHFQFKQAVDRREFAASASRPQRISILPLSHCGQQFTRGLEAPPGVAPLSVIAGSKPVTVGEFRLAFPRVALLSLISRPSVLPFTPQVGARASGLAAHTPVADGRASEGAGS